MDRTQVNSVQKLKNKVLFHVARLAFAGRLEKEKEQIPWLIIPGTKAEMRCCVYKERAILADRVRLASGKKPLRYQTVDNRESDEIIYVIDSACEECPISRFTVTDNCHNCLNKRCKMACPFQAISVEGKKAYINKDLCRECGKCKEACPYSAIADLVRPCVKSCPVNAISVDSAKKAFIDESKCIYCGNCIIQCPFGAISDISYIVDVIELLKIQRDIYAVIAPSIAGQFGDVGLVAIKQALQKLGFADVYEAAAGADLMVWEEAEAFPEFTAKNGFMASSCCPSFVELIEKHYPNLGGNLAPSLSPMLNIAVKIKGAHPSARIVFIGPCIAKKAEIEKDDRKEIIDYVLTFEELKMLFETKNLRPEDFQGNEIEFGCGSGYGRNVAKSGGIAGAVPER
jgi:ferredoxin hydrogenase large subunit